jgi:hypothetical protein
MSGERSITITVWNHSAYTLTKYGATRKKGGYATIPGASAPDGQHWQAISLAVGGSLAVVAQNDSGSCDGTIMFEDANGHVKFTIEYTHPDDKNPTSVHFVDDDNYPACISINDQGSLTGHDVTVDTGLYQGLAVNEWKSSGTEYIAGYTVPLAADPYSANNARDVVNSMFQPKIRSPHGVTHWFNQTNHLPYQPADYSGGQLVGSGTPALVQAMLNLWPGVLTSPDTGSPDYPLIQFLANFVVPTDTTQAPLSMWVPHFNYTGTYTSDDKTMPVYQLGDYHEYKLGASGTRFNMTSVQTFLQLFLAGAHFVNIQTTQDFTNLNPTANPPIANTGRDLYQAFKDAFSDDGSVTGRHSCVGNSHYTNAINTSGWYYSGQMGEWASDGCGLLLSALFAKTADGPYNTFMQLEGWPADNDWLPGQSGSLKGGARHGQDYAAYQNSYWNISTFGAAPYSEKRATTIFLAPAPWKPTIYSDTYMMPYVGAETRQGWLQTHLVSVPSGTPHTPSQYD